MLKNTEPLDYMFVHTFGEDSFAFDNDYPFIALDFLKHAYPIIEQYSNTIYADDSMYKWSPDKGMLYKLLNAILAAARQGDSYAREMLCRMYKIYYKKEYNQLKRFRQISYDELRAFENKEEIFEETAARILTICPFMGIEILDDCEFAAEDVEEILNDEEFQYKWEADDFSFGEELFKEAGEEAREFILRQKKKDRDFYLRGTVSKFKEQVFRYFCLPLDYDYICDREKGTIERNFSVTIAILKKRFRNRSFSDEEILFYYEIFNLIKALSSQICQHDNTIDMILGRDWFKFEWEHCKYRPEKQKVETVGLDFRKSRMKADEKTSISLSASAAASDTAIPADREEEYIRQISELKAALKQKQRNLDEARRQYMEAKETAKRNRIDEEMWEADRSELHRLREYVYSLTEEDVEAVSLSMDEMKAALEDRKIIIVGGHDNWTGYLKALFPSWTYIKPSISNTLPESHATNAEYLFFFTDTISHGSFNRYMNVVRKHKLQYSYLHGTNIERTVSSIYNVVCGKGLG